MKDLLILKAMFKDSDMVEFQIKELEEIFESKKTITEETIKSIVNKPHFDLLIGYARLNHPNKARVEEVHKAIQGYCLKDLKKFKLLYHINKIKPGFKGYIHDEEINFIYKALIYGCMKFTEPMNNISFSIVLNDLLTIIAFLRKSLIEDPCGETTLLIEKVNKLEETINNNF